MNPKLLTLALTTPFEELVDLPGAIRIAWSARDELQDFSEAQLQDMLVRMGTMIDDAVAQAQVDASSETDADDSVERVDQREVDWLMEALNQDQWREDSALGPYADQPNNCFFVLSLYLLGGIIDSLGDPADTVAQRTFNTAQVAALVEAQESLMLAQLLPQTVPIKTQIAQAWSDGLLPEPPPVEQQVTEQVQQAQTRLAQRAADVRHASNRAAKQKALQLSGSGEYRTVEEAGNIIGALVCRAPGTVKNWIFSANRERALATGESDSSGAPSSEIDPVLPKSSA